MRVVFDDLRVVNATPLEAVVAASDEKMLPVLIRYGATVTPENAAVLRCIADVRRVAEDIVRLLPPGPPEAGACDGVRLPW